MYASLPKIQSSLTNYSQYMNSQHEKSTTFIGLDPQKHPMQVLLILGLSIRFLFAWIHLAQIKYMETKSVVESKPDLLPQFLCSYTFTWHPASPKLFLPRAKNTSG